MLRLNMTKQFRTQWFKVYVGAPSGAIKLCAPLVPIAAKSAPTKSVTAQMQNLGYITEGIER